MNGTNLTSESNVTSASLPGEAWNIMSKACMFVSILNAIANMGHKHNEKSGELKTVFL